MKNQQMLRRMIGVFCLSIIVLILGFILVDGWMKNDMFIKSIVIVGTAGLIISGAAWGLKK